MGLYVARLGRLRFPTTRGEPKESLGDPVETIGRIAIPGDPGPRSRPITLAVRGERTEADPYAVGLRVRRQIRAMLENTRLLSGALYFAVDYDPELDCWLMLGPADLDPAERGVTFGDWQIDLSNSYKLGGPRTDRPGRDITHRDRRLSTVERDFLGQVFSTDFASAAALSMTYLPIGATDIVGSDGAPLTPSLRASADGPVPFVVGRPDGEQLAFEHDADDHGRGDVVIHTRRPHTTDDFEDRAGTLGTTLGDTLGPFVNDVGGADTDFEFADGQMRATAGFTTVRRVGWTDRQFSDVEILKKVRVPTSQSGTWTDGPGARRGSLFAQLAYYYTRLSRDAGGTATLRGYSFILGTDTGLGGAAVALSPQPNPGDELWITCRVIDQWVYSAVYNVDPWENPTALPLATHAAATGLTIADGGIMAAGHWTPQHATGYGEELRVRALTPLASDTDPQATLGWEEVYGADQDLFANEAPVIGNGVSRCRWIPNALGVIAIDHYDGGAWVEQGRVHFEDVTSGLGFTLNDVRVARWTPESSTLRLTGKTGDGITRAEIYLTLQRGWSGPNIEIYTAASTGTPRPRVCFTAAAGANEIAAARISGTTPKFWSGEATWSSAINESLGPTDEPWISLHDVAGTRKLATFSVLQLVTLSSFQATGAYGDSRKGLRFAAPVAKKYVAVKLGFGERGRVDQAETMEVASGSVTQVADGTAHGGQAVESTQTAETANVLADATVDAPSGRYASWARVRTVAAGATGTIKVYIGANFATTTFTGTTYAWVFVGEVVGSGPTDALAVNMWRSVGTGNTRIDKIALLPVERRFDFAYDGARDQAQANLTDSTQTPALVERA